MIRSTFQLVIVSSVSALLIAGTSFPSPASGPSGRSSQGRSAATSIAVEDDVGEGVGVQVGHLEERWSENPSQAASERSATPEERGPDRRRSDARGPDDGGLVTLTIPSACVDPTAVVMADPPPGKPERPPALRVNVLLPQGYNGQREFPVLYLLEGGGAYDYWLDFSYGELLSAVRDLPAIIVMPEASVVASYANSWNDGRRFPCWEHYYLDELIPAIEAQFRIRPGRRWHAIGGFSSGALGASQYAAKKPGYFGQLLSFSGVLNIQRPETQSDLGGLGILALFSPTKILETGLTPWKDAFGDPEAQEFYWAGHNPPVLAEALTHTRIYVSHGSPTKPTCVDPIQPQFHCAGQEVIGGITEDYINRSWAEDFMTAARAADADVTYRPRSGGHWYGFAAQQLADAIAHWGLFEPVPESASDWTYKTVSQSGDMWGLHFLFTQPPMELQTFRRDEAHLSGQGEGELTIRTPAGCTFALTLPFELDLSEC